MPGPFSGAVVVLTGASSGIGRALALELAAQGARLVLAARNAQALELVAEECRARGGTALVVATDVGILADCERLVARAVDAHGRIDVLVNNAGFSQIARFDEVAEIDIYEELMRVNYLGAVWLTWYALPQLKASRGLIVAVSSVSALAGIPTRTGYGASKHAMRGFFDALRVELRDSGVGVTLAAPDFVLTQIHHRALGPDGRPIGRNMMDGAAISPEACARLLARGMARRQRLVLTSWRSRLALWLGPFAPGLIDRIVARALRR